MNSLFRSRKVYLVFADPEGFSGQRDASILLSTILVKSGWVVTEIRLPALGRGSRSLVSCIGFVAKMAVAFGKLAVACMDVRALMHLNLGQSYWALFREASVISFFKLLRVCPCVIVSLHGNLYAGWASASLRARLFSFVLNLMDVVTVLGKGQIEKLTRIGVRKPEIVVIKNTCSPSLGVCVNPVEKQFRGGPVQILYLSSLIDTKGYREFIEAIECIAREGVLWVDVVLCGRIAINEYSSCFATGMEAEQWILSRVGAVNSSGKVRLNWVRGAVGAHKWELYSAAQVFVLPTEYPVEAQPIVLIEAMAAGCAIITTSVGEIQSILGQGDALFISSRDPNKIRDAISVLVADSALRAAYAREAYTRFHDDLSMVAHSAAWGELLNACIVREEQCVVL